MIHYNKLNLLHLKSMTFLNKIMLGNIYSYLMKTFRTATYNLLSQQTFVLMKTSYVFVFRRRLQNVLIKTNMFALALRLQKTSWSRPIYSSWPYVFKTSSRRLQNVFKTCSRRLQDVFKTSSRRLAKTSSRHFQGVSSS